MRILEIGAGDFFSTYGGGQVYVKNLVDELILQGEDVAVVSFVGKGLRKRDYNGHTLYEVSGDEDLRKAIEDIRPDVIHAHSHKGVSCRIGHEMGVPVVVTAHHGGIVCPAGTLLTCDDAICETKVCHKDCLRCVLRNVRTGLYWYPLMRWLPESVYVALGRCLRRLPFIPFITPIGQTALSMADKRREWQDIVNLSVRMIAPCQRLADSLMLNGYSKNKLQVITHGIPLPDNVPAWKPIKDKGVKFFYVGRICYVKGLHTLVEAFLRLDQPNAELHLIGGTGNKAEERYERSLREKTKNDPRVRWHGKVSPESVYETIGGLSSSSSSSFMEAFGLNIAESLAMGKPVLATRCGGAEQQITDGVNGWLVPSNDVDAMTKKMREICDTLVDFDVTKATKSVKSIKTHAKELVELYKSVVI